MIMRQRLDVVWMKAAVIGSIWAAIEIIAGSFLHNLRIPFAGTILAASGVFLLIAFMQHWDDRFIILRAGIICALMKSVSPSAIIAGPMIGIFAEALIIESARLILGRNLIAYIIGGALAVLWTLIQKILSLLILYGFDLIRVAESLYDFLVAQTGITGLDPWYLIAGVSSLYLLIGAIAAAEGYRQGKNVKSKKKKIKDLNIEQKKGKSFFSIHKDQKYSILLFGLVLITVIAVLFLLNRQYYIISLPLGVLFITFILLRYKQSIHRLKKPAIWIQFGVIILIASFLWEWVSTGQYFTFRGLIAGLEMSFRAMIIIFGFTAISSELRNPLIKGLLFNYGFYRLYQALSISFAALPAVIASLPQFKYMLRQRKLVLMDVFGQADGLLEYFEESMRVKDNIFVITGDIHQGKTTFAKELVNKLKNEGYKVKGFFSAGEFKDNRRYSFMLENVETGNTSILAYREKQPGWFAFKSYYFNPDTIIEGNRIIKDAVEKHPDFLIIDEVGPMELQHKGWYESLVVAADQSKLLQIWVVRKNKLNQVLLTWNLSKSNCFDISKVDVDAVKKTLINARMRI